jgi:predicted lipoprotein with Yx(FWY)xxD motif
MKKTPPERTNGKFSRRGLAAIVIMASGASLLATTVLPGVSGASSGSTTIKVSQNKTWGPTLTLKDGFTVYRLTKDSNNKSVCTGKCATVWLPVVLAPGQNAPVGVGVSGLGSFARANGTKQVTFQGIPLYTFTKDKKAGAVTGNIKDGWGQWWSINPKSPHTAPKKSGGSGNTTTTTTAGGGVGY